MELATDNQDLIWDLTAVEKYHQLVDFLMALESHIGIYSQVDQKLYTQYNIFFPKDDMNQLVILPNPYATARIYKGIPTGAIVQTTFKIVPGALFDRKGVQLMIPFKTGKLRFRPVPLKAGLNIINEYKHLKAPFLPLLTKDSLQKLDDGTPCLYLYAVKPDYLNELADGDRETIQDAIMQPLANLLS